MIVILAYVIAVETLFILFFCVKWKTKRHKIEPKDLIDMDSWKSMSDAMVKYNQLVYDLDRDRKGYFRKLDNLDAHMRGHKPIQLFYNLDVDRAKVHEIDQGLLEATLKLEIFQQAMLETEIIKEIIKRGHVTFYRNRIGEFWSKPDPTGGYIIYKQGEFFDAP